MTKRVVRRKSVKKVNSSKNTFKEIKPSSVEEIVPHTRYIVKLDCEDTKFLITFRNDSIVQCMALDGTYETITVPISQFNRAKYTFEYDDCGEPKEYIAKLKVYEG